MDRPSQLDESPTEHQRLNAVSTRAYHTKPSYQLVMQNITEYRKQILQALRAASDPDGRRRLTDEEAARLAKEFSDEELAFGMDYNTPEEVADMLLDADL